MKLYAVLIMASFKMYFRNKQAIFWALFFPLLIMIIFGLLNFDKFTPPDVGLVDRADNEASAAFINTVAPDKDPLFDLEQDTEENLRDDLSNGDIDALIILPPNFGEAGSESELQVVYDTRKATEQGIVATVINDTLDAIFQDIASVPDEYRVESRFTVNASFIEGQGEGFKGFLVPGVAAMAIMQAGIFSVVFGLIRFKSTGVLRRLKATPVGPSHFLVGQISVRLIVAVLQTYVLLIAGMLILRVSIGNGTVINWIDLTIVAFFGGALFNTMGLAISGWATTEDVAAPVANIVSLPMMFLSGIFFPLDVLPDWLSAVSKFFPLTYLADGLREVTVNGAGITSLGPELLGLGIWTAVSFVVAVRVFRWE